MQIAVSQMSLVCIHPKYLLNLEDAEKHPQQYCQGKYLFLLVCSIF